MATVLGDSIPYPELHLEEVWSSPFPDSLFFGGSSLAGADGLRIWTRTPFRLLDFIDGKPVKMNAIVEDRERDFVPTDAQGRLLLFDRRSGEIRALDGRNTVAPVRFRSDWIEVETASLTRTEVFVAGTSEAGYAVAEFDRSTGALSGRNDSLVPPSQGFQSGRLLVIKDQPVLFLLRYPFRVFDLNDLESPEVIFELTDSAASSLVSSGKSTELANWISLAFVRLDMGFLMQLADPTSDERALLLIGEDWELIRTRTVTAPFGILGAEPEGRMLFAMRDMNPKEVVAYRWHWSRVPEGSR